MPLKGLPEMRKALKKVDEPYNTALRAIYFQGLGNIAGGTPEDTGRAAGNWFMRDGTPSTESTTSTNGGDDLDKMPQWVLGKRLYYANNMPYINMLEYGGYPGTGPNTINGWSRRVDIGGWVRVELLSMRKGIRNI